MCPAIASGIVTEDALVSYWPMLLAIITICTRAQLHSKTISGFACVASVSVRFLSKESKTARTPPPPPPPTPLPLIHFHFWLSFHFSRGQTETLACYAGYIRV